MTYYSPIPHGGTARRLEWQHLPPELRGYIEGRLGSPVAEATSQGAGFTPGFASRLRGESGERLFVKAASKKAQKHFAESYVEEARQLASLPPGLPATRLLWAHEDDAWVVLGFEAVEGRAPERPWNGPDLRACLTALELVAEIEPPESMHLKLICDELPTLPTAWQTVFRLHPDWPHLDDAAGLAGGLPRIPGRALLHCDARDDNFLLTPSGDALLCDWNWPVLGPAWLDAVVVMISVHGDGGDAELALSSSALTAGVPSEHIDTWLAAYAGYMTEAADRPIPPTSPYLRTHQAWYASAAWSWLTIRRGWQDFDAPSR